MIYLKKGCLNVNKCSGFVYQ